MNQTNKVQSLLFERTLIAFTKLIPEARIAEWQAGLSLRALPDIAEEFAAILRVWLLSGHKVDVLTESDTIDFPASPWQFFKQQYAPKWFLRRFPVVMETKHFRVAIHHHYVCPHVEVPNEKGPHVHYAWMGEMSGQIPKYPV